METNINLYNDECFYFLQYAFLGWSLCSVVVTASCNNMFVKKESMRTFLFDAWKESMRTFLFDAWISTFSICISLLVIV